MNHFRTEACKQMLLYPGSLNQEKSQKIKLKIDDSEATKCFMCPMFVRSGQCSKAYSNFSTSKCSCGNLMDEVIQFQGEGGRASGSEGGVFVRSGHTSFIITDDLKVEVNTVVSTLDVLKDLGYDDCDKLVEMILDVNLEEVVTLLECLFTSDAPLTDTFLKKKSSNGIKRILKTLSPLSEDRKESETITLNAYVRKKEGNILYVECGQDFVDLLFTFLAMPLEFVWEISGGGIIIGCIGNLCKSFKDLSVVDAGREASGFKCVLPHYYKCQKQILVDVVTTHQPPSYYRFVSFSVDHFREYCLSENSGKRLVYDWDKLVPVTSIDPKTEGNDTAETSGFVKSGTKFMVTDDLIITPSNSTSTIGFLKEKQTRLDEVEVRVINMTKVEVIRLLGASMVTSSALSTRLLAIESASTSAPQTRYYISLRLIVDEEKNKVVLAEGGKDFVDVLFSLLLLPIGTVIRLLRKQRNSAPIPVGCFSNLYKSVEDMDIDNFETAACKKMLLHPRSLRDYISKRLKVNINPDGGVKFYTCPNFSNCAMCSNFSCSVCKCGRLMDKEIQLTEVDNVADKIQNDGGVFVKGRFSFIITDDLKVSVDSTGLVLNTLSCLGYADLSKLGERRLDIGLEEVLTLLGCLFSSNNTPLTDTFLNTQRLHDVTQISKLLSPSVKEKELLTLNVIVRKQDKKFLYVECCEDFVDLLFSFLADPLASIWELTGNNITLGCIGNLNRSFKDLSSFGCVLPHYYRFHKPLSMIRIERPCPYYRYLSYTDWCLTTKFQRNLDRISPVTLIDPKSRGSSQSNSGSGFVKRATRFIVFDDLIITPKDSSITSFHLLKKLQIRADDLEVQVISIGETEVISMLGASLVTSSALNKGLWNLISRKLKEET